MHAPSHSAVITLIPSLPLPELLRDSGRSCQGSLPSEPALTHTPCPTSVKQLCTWQALAPSVPPETGSSEWVLGWLGTWQSRLTWFRVWSLHPSPCCLQRGEGPGWRLSMGPAGCLKSLVLLTPEPQFLHLHDGKPAQPVPSCFSDQP